METKRVAASLGTVWLKKGWNLFRKDPLLWVILTCIWIAVMGILLVIPWIGAAVMWILGPAIYAGFIFSASELDQDRELRAEYLFRGLRDPHKRMPLITLGCITFALFLIFSTVSRTFYMVPWIQAGVAIQLGDIVGIVLRVLIFSLLVLLMFIALTYSGPSIMFRGIEPFEALMNSCGACLKNWRPLLIFFVISIGLALLAAIPFGLGLLVFIPVMFCALYFSYKDIYGMA